MRGGRRRELPYVFSPGKKLLHIVVEMKDIPRAYASVLEILGSRVNLIGTISYSKEESAIFSGFAEALTATDSPEELRKAIRRSPMVLDCMITEGSEGVLVDSFHKGLETSSGEPLLMFKRNGMRRMFDRISERFADGQGETILYDEGVAVGASDASEIQERWRPGFMAEGFPMLLSLFSAFGWGNATSTGRTAAGTVTIRMDDCFECSPSRQPGRSCAFVRGFMVGSAGVFLRTEVKCEETACRFKGNDHCEFTVDVSGAPVPSR